MLYYFIQDRLSIILCLQAVKVSLIFYKTRNEDINYRNEINSLRGKVGSNQKEWLKNGDDFIEKFPT